MGELQLAAASFAAAALAAVNCAAGAAGAAAADAGGSTDGARGVLTAEEVDELRADAKVTCDV